MLKMLYLTIKSIFIYIKNVLNVIWNAIYKLLVFTVNFLSQCENSVKGELNEQEIYRVVSVTLSSGGSLYAIIKALYANVDGLVNNPTMAYEIKAFVEALRSHDTVMIIMAVIFVGDLIRRKYLHGQPNES